MKKKISIYQLQRGQIVRLRNGEYYQFDGGLKRSLDIARDWTSIIDKERRRYSVLRNDRGYPCYCMADYNDDLTHNTTPELDIVAVYPVPNWKKGFNPDTSESLWDADEVFEISIEELEKKFGCKIKIIE